MAQWQKLLSLDSELQGGVTQLYEGKFPRELRHWLCSQIESHNWGLAASDENEANACFHSLLDYLEEQWKRSVQEHSILQGPDFAGMRAYLLKNFQDNPKYLATILFECLEMEKRILDAAAEEQPCCGPTLEPNAIQLDGKISDLESLSLEIKKESKSLESSYERLEYMQEACGDQSIAEGMKQVPVQQHVGLARCLANVKEKCRAQADNIAQKKQVLLQNTMKMVKEAEEIVLQLVDEELPEWRRRQRLACVGAPLDTSLDRLQNWFTSVVGTLLELREQLQELQQQDRKYNSVQGSEFSAPLEATEKAAASLCLKLLRSALVVEKQPVMASLPQRPQIVKTGVRFTVSVRFLANLPRFKYQLRVKPEFDKNVEEAGTIKGFRQFRISKDDSKVLDEDTPGGGLVAEFCHMSLKEAKAKVKGTTETRLGVTEELHLVTFVTEFRHAGLECTIEASSLPLVVISSSNQVVSAWASIMWCSALCTGDPANLSLFVEPPPLPWTQLSQLLSWQFLTVGRRQLDPDQLSHLREKFLDGPDQLVHWSQFFKENWIWIDGILELIKKHLVNLWKEGLIMGFVSRKGTKELLRDKENGTFLLRFSESSKEGAITFSWVEHINGETQVHAVQPYTSNELSLMSLPRILHHFNVKSQNCSSGNPLLYLYPRIPKDSVFEGLDTDKPEPFPDYLFRMFIPVSRLPPSPPPDIMMDVDVDVDSIVVPLAPSHRADLRLCPQVDASLQLEELFPEIFFGLSPTASPQLSLSDGS